MLMTLNQAKENPLECEEFQLKNWLSMLEEYIKRDTPMKVERMTLSGCCIRHKCNELMKIGVREGFCNECGQAIE